MSSQCCIRCLPYSCIRKHICPCHKNGQGQPKVIIWKYAPGHGHTTIWNKFWQHFKAFIIPIILYQLQKDPFCLIILYDILFYVIHVYISPGQEETTLGDIFFDGSRKVLSLSSLVGCFNKQLCPLISCTFFMISYMYIALWQGQTAHYGQTFDVNRKASSFMSFLASFKNIYSASDFIHIFSWFNKRKKPQVRGRQPPGEIILMSTETICPFGHLLQVSKTSLWSLILYTFFHDFIHVYSPWIDADNPF